MIATFNAANTAKDSFLRMYFLLEPDAAYLAGIDILKIGSLDSTVPENEKDDYCMVVNLHKGFPYGEILPSQYHGIRVFYRTKGAAVKYEKRKLRRMKGIEAWLGGVCSGIAYWMGIPVWITRLAWFVSVYYFWPVGLSLYILLSIFLPKWEENPRNLKIVTED